SALTGLLGIQRLQLAEDSVQDAMIRALQTWPYYGVPDNPAAWLMRTAKHRALDVIRREKVFYQKQPEIVATLEPAADEAGPVSDDEIPDDRLRLIFVCCHPLIPQEDQVFLALKTLCGFNVAEIASAFLSTEAAVAKRLTRAKQKIQDQGIAYEIPEGADLVARLDAVLQVIYLLFNEGYKASKGDSVLREDLCQEAIRLAGFLVSHPAGDHPHTHALLALMLLDAARFAARQDAEGVLIRLRDQDRSLWNRGLIGAGLMHLSRSGTGRDLSEYHLQAGIAACHATAATYAGTDWPRILSHYDLWLQIDPSPIVRLNRSVAVAKVHGPRAGIEAIHAIPENARLESYHLYHAVLGDLEEQLEDFKSAAAHFRRAAELTGVAAERAFLEERLRACGVEL
ncbi:MAG: sigma factor, subfamily protein, partial [Akkermansiaceae bacterium]|nr:sigma factor, subfamily protein [Akkermansiaceae bacterium]